jgi:hypothetical protein
VKLLLSAFFLVVTMGVGTGFYMYTEGWSFTNALYWSFTTTSTIGYGNLGSGSTEAYGAPVHRESAMWFSLVYVLLSSVFIGFAVKRMYSVYDDVQVGGLYTAQSCYVWDTTLDPNSPLNTLTRVPVRCPNSHIGSVCFL